MTQIIKKLLKFSSILNIGILISRILGYVRDTLIAFYFGASKTSDAFFIAWMIPNTLREIVGEGSLNAGFLPVFSEVYKRNNTEGINFASIFLGRLIVICIILTILGILFSDWIVRIIAPGFIRVGIFELTSLLTKILFLSVVFISAVALAMAILISREKFILPALSSAILNIAMICSLICLYFKLGVFSLVVGVLIGSIVEFISLFIGLYKNNIKLKLFIPLGENSIYKKYLKEVFKLLIPRFLTTFVLYLNIILSRIWGSFLGPGVVSGLYYANRLIQLPLALFGISPSLSIMPLVISRYNQVDIDTLLKEIYQVIKFTLLVNIPFIFILLFLGKFIIGILFERGEFSAAETALTYKATAFYSIGLIGFSTTRLLSAIYYSIQNTKIPLFSSAITLLVNFLFCIVLIPYLHIGGIALASSISSILNSLILILLLKKTLLKGYIIKKNNIIKNNN